MFCVPIRVRGRVTGFFGVDSLRRRSWRLDQADLLIIVSGLLSGALERNRLEEELLNQSIRDPLTGLHNRRYLMPRLEEMLGRSNRRGENVSPWRSSTSITSRRSTTQSDTSGAIISSSALLTSW